MKIKRHFKYMGHEWNLNDNRIGISKANYEFFSKYKIMHYLGSEEWEECGAVETKQEAKQVIKQLVNGVFKYS